MLRKIENNIFPTINEAFENMTDGNSAIVTSSFEDLGLILCNIYYLWVLKALFIRTYWILSSQKNWWEAEGNLFLNWNSEKYFFKEGHKFMLMFLFLFRFTALWTYQCRYNEAPWWWDHWFYKRKMG